MRTTEAAGRVKGRIEMNLAGDTGEVLIYGDIGYYASNYFLEKLTAIGNARTLDVRINSPGGLASEGIAIYQALVRHPAQKNVYIDAAAYSAASIIAMAASPGQLRMAFNARIMIHEGWNEAMGSKRELRKVADILELLDGTIAKTYAKRMSKYSPEQILALMEEETWYNAEQAVEVGLVDDIFEGDEQLPAETASAVKRFKNPPKDLVERAAAQADEVLSEKDEAARRLYAVTFAERIAALESEPLAMAEFEQTRQRINDAVKKAA